MGTVNLFKQRKIIGESITNLINDKGYTKAYFAEMINISRPTLNKLLSGEIGCSKRFKQYLDKIVEIQNIDLKKLVNYPKEIYFDKSTVFVYSNNLTELKAIELSQVDISKQNLKNNNESSDSDIKEYQKCKALNKKLVSKIRKLKLEIFILKRNILK